MHTAYVIVPPGRTRSAATRSRSSWSSGSGSARQRRSGRGVEDAEPGAGGVHERAVEAAEVVRERQRVGVDHGELDAETARVLRQLPGTARVLLDGDHIGAQRRQLRRLASGRRAEIQNSLSGPRGDGSSRKLRATALRPGVPALQPFGRDRVDHKRPLGRAHRDLRRLVLRAHQRPRAIRAQLPPPGLRNPVRVGVQERSCGRRLLVEAREQVREPLREPPEHRVGERDGALEPGSPHELDGLVHRGVRRDAVQECELVGPGAERGANGWVELSHRPAPQRLDRMVERPHPLHGAVRDLLRKGPVARVQALRGAPERPVGVGAFLEDPLDDPGRDRSGGAHGPAGP